MDAQDNLLLQRFFESKQYSEGMYLQSEGIYTCGQLKFVFYYHEDTRLMRKEYYRNGHVYKSVNY